jgi:hypothetical protein
VESKSRISGADLRSLEEFELRWRWTSSSHHPLDPATLQRILPLTHEAARAADEQATPISVDRLQRLGVTHDNDAREWLEERLPAEPAPVLVSWSSDLAVLTDSHVFLTHWDAFCYPGSDDVDCRPLDGSWVVAYRHYGTLYFG